MDTTIVTSTITDLRHKTNKVLLKAEEKGYVYLLRRSKIAAAVVDIKYLNDLQEAYEDYLDTLEYDKTIKLKRNPLSKAKKSK
ncbi:hypothetical protein A2774_05630 [Candidatus Roizmanbacteria bacterium RIFCSPHIGHO2_01_FULL_39_12c]|uniref:Antitoxin n=1 Tax=Candidatus Roizmanbacteria bacterium RIFCSPHIGHO2_01_FULL_39_12c TaxID=1802031 RepID=A0A1F7GF53_9BACT|nr:MAG: hypothetical protein A2774_05630 [Candidatus Roizmanbacteria bacterium RIFCSPHIGHO2_01_FULL_39_12c]